MKYTISNNDTTVLSRQSAMHQHVLSRQLKALGSKGGKVRAQKLTPEQRQDIASKAANARWQGENNNGLRSTQRSLISESTG